VVEAWTRQRCCSKRVCPAHVRAVGDSQTQHSERSAVNSGTSALGTGPP
jgi:hypothetical protein